MQGGERKSAYECSIKCVMSIDSEKQNKREIMEKREENRKIILEKMRERLERKALVFKFVQNVKM